MDLVTVAGDAGRNGETLIPSATGGKRAAWQKQARGRRFLPDCVFLFRAEPGEGQELGSGSTVALWQGGTVALISQKVLPDVGLGCALPRARDIVLKVTMEGQSRRAPPSPP